MTRLHGRDQTARWRFLSIPSTGHRRPHPVREIVLVLVLFLAYKLGRLAVADDLREATANAHRVWGVERRLHLPSEEWVQSALLQSHEVTRLANEFYAFVHFPATVAFLVWIWVWRPAHYLGARRSLTVVTALALVIHLTFPLAPPRLVPSLGMVDTAATVGPAVYGDPQTDLLTNQFAAMPSLHIGWAVLTAVVLARATRGRRRWWWALHPTLTTLVVVATANHYWADGITAGMLVAGTVALVLVPTDRRSGLTRPPSAPHPPTAADRTLRLVTTQSNGLPVPDGHDDTRDHDPAALSVPTEPPSVHGDDT